MKGANIMKLQIGNYEVEVKAKSIIKEKKNYNKEDTMYFLNSISVALDYAKECTKSKGYDGMANSYKEASDGIYEILDELGFYSK